MNTKSIKAEVWRFILIPALSISLLLASALTYLFLMQLHQFVEWRGTSIARNTAVLAHQALSTDSAHLLPAILAASREEHYVRSLALHDRQGQHSLHLGAEFLAYSDTGMSPNPDTPTLRETARSLRFSHPLISAAGDESLGWLEVEVITSPFIVLHYRTLLITLVITLLTLGLSSFLAVRLHGKITRPINAVKQALENLTAGKLQQRIAAQDCLEFSELAATVNTMAQSLEQAQQEMQLHIDQATEDLRETLETIEIQNIELNMARKEALEASRIKSEFLTNTSHEIRTPLNGILGFTNLVLKTDLTSQQQDYLHTIRDSSQKLLTIINDILDFSKIEAGKLTLEYAPLPLRQVIEETLHNHAPQAHDKQLQLSALIDPQLPLQLLGDALRFKQVLSNLLSNAIKFSNQGEIVVAAELLSRSEAHITLKISVTDEGIGVSDEQKARLFGAFAQVDMSSAREHGGTGLGLAISKGLVERMGGEIGLSSEHQKGSNFWFSARLSLDKHAPAEPPRPDCSEYRALICSRSEAISAQLTQILDHWQCASTRTPAIHDIFTCLRAAAAEQQPCSVLILDVAPDERKIQPALLANLAEQLEQEFQCKLLVCCTPAYQRLLSNGDSLPSAQFVHKPIAQCELLQALAQQLDIALGDPGTETSATAAHAVLAPSQVLVVDDNPANLQLASELLRCLHMEVTQATNGRQALEACKQKSFDLIFMDIQMPGMDGIETTRRLREQYRGLQRTPIIALTAHSLTDQKAELLISGLDDCLSKPVSEAQLAHMIQRWLRPPTPGKSAPEPLPAVIPPPSAAPESDHSHNPVDIALSLRLANNKPELARDMLTMLLADLATDQQAIQQAWEQGDVEQLEQRVHKLYGSSCYCGVPELKAASGQLDKLLQQGEHTQLAAQLTTLQQAIERVLCWSFERDLNALFNLETSS